jgi:hypothetical protein
LQFFKKLADFSSSASIANGESSTISVILFFFRVKSKRVKVGKQSKHKNLKLYSYSTLTLQSTLSKRVEQARVPSLTLNTRIDRATKFYYYESINHLGATFHQNYIKIQENIKLIEFLTVDNFVALFGTPVGSKCKV